MNISLKWLINFFFVKYWKIFWVFVMLLSKIVYVSKNVVFWIYKAIIISLDKKMYSKAVSKEHCKLNEYIEKISKNVKRIENCHCEAQTVDKLYWSLNDLKIKNVLGILNKTTSSVWMKNGELSFRDNFINDLWKDIHLILLNNLGIHLMFRKFLIQMNNFFEVFGTCLKSCKFLY